MRVAVSAPSSPLRPWLLGAALVALIVTVFSGVVNHDFVSFDDAKYIYENPHLVGGLTLENVR